MRKPLDPIAYWNLNETSGTYVADTAGTPQNGTVFARGKPDLDDAGPPMTIASWFAAIPPVKLFAPTRRPLRFSFIPASPKLNAR